MLHGSGGSNTEWQGYGLFGAADHLIGTGAIDPLVIVLPQGDQSFWMDHAGGGPRWGTYTAHDVVAEVDRRFRTVANRGHRAIGGLSMGADGALQLAMNYPDEFSVVGAHSPTLRPYGQWPSFFGDQAYSADHDAAQLFRARPNLAGRLAIEVDTGTKDTQWRPSAEAFHQQLLAEGIAHEWHDQWPGDHSGAYWGAHTEDYLRFYDRAIKAQTGRAG
jgi:S-formylglutathione hydrolase FrmB